MQGEQVAHGQNDVQEAITRGKGALAEKQAARAAIVALLPEAHKAHARRYGKRETRTSEQVEGERWKAREGARGNQCQHKVEGGDDQE